MIAVGIVRQSGHGDHDLTPVRLTSPQAGVTIARCSTRARSGGCGAKSRGVPSNPKNVTEPCCWTALHCGRIFQRTASYIVIHPGSHGCIDRHRCGVPCELSRRTLGQAGNVKKPPRRAKPRDPRWKIGQVDGRAASFGASSHFLALKRRVADCGHILVDGVRADRRTHCRGTTLTSSHSSLPRDWRNA
jgi:hypothetical protein